MARDFNAFQPPKDRRLGRKVSFAEMSTRRGSDSAVDIIIVDDSDVEVTVRGEVEHHQGGRVTSPLAITDNNNNNNNSSSSDDNSDDNSPRDLSGNPLLDKDHVTMVEPDDVDNNKPEDDNTLTETTSKGSETVAESLLSTGAVESPKPVRESVPLIPKFKTPAPLTSSRSVSAATNRVERFEVNSARSAQTVREQQPLFDLDSRECLALVVEDSLVARKLMRRALNKIGVVVDVAEDGRVGVEKALETNYHIIFMDKEMVCPKPVKSSTLRELLERHVMAWS